MRGWIILVGCVGCVGVGCVGAGSGASNPSDMVVGSQDTSVSEPSDTESDPTTDDSSGTVDPTGHTGSSTTTSSPDCTTGDGDYDPVGTWDLLAYRPVEWQGPAGTTYTFPETETLSGDVSLDIHSDGTWLFAVSYDTGTLTDSSVQTWGSEPDAVLLHQGEDVDWSCVPTSCLWMTCLVESSEDRYLKWEADLGRR